MWCVLVQEGGEDQAPVPLTNYHGGTVALGSHLDVLGGRYHSIKASGEHFGWSQSWIDVGRQLDTVRLPWNGDGNISWAAVSVDGVLREVIFVASHDGSTVKR